MIGRGLTLVVELSIDDLDFPLVQLVGVCCCLSRRVLKVAVLAVTAVGVGGGVDRGHCCVRGVQRRFGVFAVDHYLTLVFVVEFDMSIGYRYAFGRRRAETCIREFVS